MRFFVLVILLNCNFYIQAQNSSYSFTKDTSVINLIIDFGKTYKGVSYQYGSCSAMNNGFDCSGFIHFIFKMAGIKLPRSSSAMASEGKIVNLKKLKKGDLLYFNTSQKKQVSHVGIISSLEGDELTMLHVSSSKGVQEINVFKSPYWKANFLFGKRL